LMIALPLDWLTVTAGPPWPRIVAEPPTTVPPAGPAAAGAAPSARSAAVVSRRLRKRGCMPTVPSAEESCLFTLPWLSRLRRAIVPTGPSAITALSQPRRRLTPTLTNRDCIHAVECAQPQTERQPDTVSLKRREKLSDPPPDKECDRGLG